MKILLLAIGIALCATNAQAAKMRTSWYEARGPSIVAHRHLPFGTRLLLYNPQTKKKVYAIVHDRGPFVRGVSLDVSRSIATRLGMIKRGVVVLWVKILRRHRR